MRRCRDEDNEWIFRSIDDEDVKKRVQLPLPEIVGGRRIRKRNSGRMKPCLNVDCLHISE